MRWFDTTQDFVDLMNVDPSNGKARSGNSKISRFTYYGHGSAAGLWLTYDPGAEAGEIFTQAHLLPLKYQKHKFFKGKFIQPTAFSKNAQCVSWACNSGTGGEASFIDAWQNSLGVSMSGVVGKTDYANTSPNVMRWRMRQFNGGMLSLPLQLPEKYAPRHPTLGSKPWWGDAYMRTL